MGQLIPEAWLTPALIDKCICHWTAGSYVVSSTDRDHYHCILGQEVSGGPIVAVKGDHTPADNDYTGDDDYAAHCKNCNTGSYGLSVACMAGAVEGGSSGQYPLTQHLWDALVVGAADVRVAYELEVSQRTVLFHSEVQEVYGKPQEGKWDIDYLPFSPDLSPEEVHHQFRERVIAAVEGAGKVVVIVNGTELPEAGYLKQDRSWIPVRPATEMLSDAWHDAWHLGPITTAPNGTQRIALVGITASYQITLENREGTGYVLATDLRPSAVTVTWNDADKSVSLVG